MYYVTKYFEVSYAHRLMKHPGKCKNLHGHNGRIGVTFSSDWLKDGMVADFDEIKWWFEPARRFLDHKTILQSGDPVIGALTESQEVVTIEEPPTAEVLAEWVAKVMYPNTPAIVEFWETPDNKAEWRAEVDSRGVVVERGVTQSDD